MCDVSFNYVYLLKWDVTIGLVLQELLDIEFL